MKPTTAGAPPPSVMSIIEPSARLIVTSPSSERFTPKTAPMPAVFGMWRMTPVAPISRRMSPPRRTSSLVSSCTTAVMAPPVLDW